LDARRSIFSVGLLLGCGIEDYPTGPLNI